MENQAASIPCMHVYHVCSKWTLSNEKIKRNIKRTKSAVEKAGTRKGMGKSRSKQVKWSLKSRKMTGFYPKQPAGTSWVKPFFLSSAKETLEEILQSCMNSQRVWRQQKVFACTFVSTGLCKSVSESGATPSETRDAPSNTRWQFLTLASTWFKGAMLKISILRRGT